LPGVTDVNPLEKPHSVGWVAGGREPNANCMVVRNNHIVGYLELSKFCTGRDAQDFPPGK